jgi:hypothetical protein
MLRKNITPSRASDGVPTEFFDDARKMIIKGRLDATDGAEDE